MVPDGTDATVVLTGATSGIGRAAALDLADRGATVAAVGRDRERGRSLVAAGDERAGTVEFYRADLADQRTVRDLATDLRSELPSIDVVVHNAGLSTAERRESPDGVELTLAVNHLAPYLLTHELVDRLEASAPSRVVVTASGLHREADLDVEDLQLEAGYDTKTAYSRSKLANVAFTLELAERLSGTGVTANCFTPGFVPSTDLFRDLAVWRRLQVGVARLLPGVGTDVETGAQRLVQLVTDPEYGERTGAFVEDGVPTEPAAAARDPEGRARLWRVSADLVGVDPDWP